jgi:hypothetical protein
MIETAPTTIYQLVYSISMAIIILQVAVVAFFLKEQAKALKENTHAVIRLSAQLEFVLEEVHKIPEIQSDLNKLGSKLRSYDS